MKMYMFIRFSDSQVGVFIFAKMYIYKSIGGISIKSTPPILDFAFLYANYNVTHVETVCLLSKKPQ